MKAIVGDGKYEIVFDEKAGHLSAYRHGELWRDLVGDNMVLSMLQRIVELEEKSKHWTDAHITHDDDNDCFVAFDETGGKLDQFPTHGEARDALVLYSHSLNKPQTAGLSNLAAQFAELRLANVKLSKYLSETAKILGLNLIEDPGFVPVRAAIVVEAYRQLNRQLNAHLEADQDSQRLVRELDVLLNGKGAAPQASLCDIVAQLKNQIQN